MFGKSDGDGLVLHVALLNNLASAKGADGGGGKRGDDAAPQGDAAAPSGGPGGDCGSGAYPPGADELGEGCRPPPGTGDRAESPPAAAGSSLLRKGTGVWCAKFHD